MIWLMLAACSDRDCPTVDADGDGAPEACPGEEITADGFVDCDDSDPTSRPGADELCDGVDNNCDGTVDEGLSLSYFLDSDGDGYGGDELVTCQPPEGYVRLGGDCDDADPTITPGADELCDGIDNDCDGSADEGVADQLWYADADGDGFPSETDAMKSCEAPDGYLPESQRWDCDDTDAGINPDGEEQCDGADNDCDGETDEGVPSLWYVDSDGDGYGGDSSITGENCFPDDGYSLNSDDCDDRDDSISDSFPDPLDGDGVVVEAADIDDLCPCYSAIDGMLRIRNLTDASDLSGLECIESVENLLISDNDSLTSLDGLEGITTVEGYITIQDNDQLSDISALAGVTELSSYLSVQGNPALEDLSGLSGLTRIEGALLLADNDSMTALDMAALEEVGGLTLSSCALEEIGGMPSLTTIDRDLSVSSCSELAAIDLPALESVGGDLYLYNNAAFSSLSVESLSSVGGELRLHWQAGIPDLDGLSGMRSVGDDLVIWGNAALTDVSGLHGLEQVSGDLTISNNPNLTTEDAETLEESIDTLRGSTTISNNGS